MSIQFTRLPGYDINGNPRYVCHYHNLLTEQEKSNLENVQRVYQGMTQGYHIAVARSRKIGGRKYHTKAYGGGIVFQSYATESTNCEREFLKELEQSIKDIVAKESGE